MRISSDTRLATIRHCATKLPLLLLLYLVCPDPLTVTAPSSLRSTLYALLLLLVVVRPLVLTLDESLARSLLANPFPQLLPPPPPPPPHRRHSHRPPLRDWSKRVSQFGWRAHSIWQCGRSPLLGLLLTGLVLLAIPIVDLLSNFTPTSQQEREQGWSVVAGRWLISRINVGPAEAGAANTARGWKPLRNVIWLEILDALACVLHGLLPLLIHLRLLPPTLSGSFLLTDSEDQSRHDPATGHSPIRKSPPPSSSTASSSSSAALPSLQFPTSHLLSSFHLAILSPSITLLQILQLVLARSPSTHKWLGGFWCTLVLLVAILLPLDAIAVIRERSTREAERLLEIGQTFAAAGDQGGGRGGGKEDGPEDGDEDEIEDQWICSICLLRGSDDSPEEDAPLGQDDDDNARSSDPDNPEKQTITFDTRCHLPCAHSFHAHCLSTWFSTVSSCPTCHRTIKRSTPSSSIAGNSSTPLPSPAAAVPSRDRPAPLSVSEPYFTRDARERARARAESEAREQQSRQVDQYPGAAAAAARDRRRAARGGDVAAPSSDDARHPTVAGIIVDWAALFPPPPSSSSSSLSSSQRLGRSTPPNSEEESVRRSEF